MADSLKGEPRVKDDGLPEWLLSLLVCPVDRNRLKMTGTELECRACGRRYPIRDGIPVMIPDEAETER